MTDFPRRTAKKALLWSLACMMGCSVAANGPLQAAPAAYRLDTGDIIDVDIYGIAEFKRRATVNVDGDLALPFIGALHVSGLSLAELRHSIATQLMQLQVIQNPQVTVEIAEHRPFYISGDVSRPGAIPYRKGLAVRHAIALAGGFDVLHFRTDNPLMVTPELRARQQAQWLDLVKIEARAASIEAELADRTSFDLPAAAIPPYVAPSVVTEIVLAEQRALKARLQEWTMRVTFQQDRIRQIKDNVADLSFGLQQQSEALTYQATAVERVADNVAKGITPVNRGAEERRGLAQIKSQEIENRSKLSQAQAEFATAEREFDRMKGERVSDLNRAFEEVTIAREKVRLDLKATQEKLLYAGAAKAQMGRAATPDILIYRVVEGVTTAIAADPDTEIHPGDLLDVMINHQAASANSQ
jgi:polysaccharide export outer membrane protein